MHNFLSAEKDISFIGKYPVNYACPHSVSRGCITSR
jgi:hypothetical protein